MDLSAAFSDDQIAVLGCFCALAVCGLVGLISFHFGPAGKSAADSSRQNLTFQRSDDQVGVKDSRKAA